MIGTHASHSQSSLTADTLRSRLLLLSLMKRSKDPVNTISGAMSSRKQIFVLKDRAVSLQPSLVRPLPVLF